MPDTRTVDIAIVGAGASGVLVAMQLVRQSRNSSVATPSIALVDSRAEFGRGAAYSTTRPEHVLNVPAGNMSLFPDDAGHFVRWLLEQGEPEDRLGHRYIERRVYARYLQATLDAETGSGLQRIRDRVVALHADDGGYRLRLEGGDCVLASAVVLAVGNHARALPLPHDGIEVLNAWDADALGLIAAVEDVAIIGAGLSMVDAALTLAANGHRGRIDVFSRHGLAPLPHAGHTPAPIDIEAFVALPLRQRVHRLRALIRTAAAAGDPWQSVVQSLRGPGQRLWQSMSEREQRQFLRHVVRYWDIHRHRIAPEIDHALADLRASGQLHLHAGRPQSLHAMHGRVRIDFVARHETTSQNLVVDRIVNATGLETRLENVANPLLQSLLAGGLARPGPHERGLDSAADGRLLDRSGVAQSMLYTLGSPRIGTLWETIAIPDLRVQAAALATRLLEATPASG